MSSTTRRLHVRSFTIAGAVVASIVLAAATATAHSAPPPITDTFATGDDGWEIYEGASEHDAGWVSSGGNPGGFIRYSDPEAQSSSAVFADEDYVSHISRYIGVGNIVFDLKTNATDSRAPRVWITDPDNPGFPAIHSDLKRAPDGEWHHYTIPVDATAARWVDGDGDRVGPARFKKLLDRNPVFVVRADYSRSVGEKTDFDSVGLELNISRKLTLAYRAKTRKLKGRLTAEESSMPSCATSQKVTLMRVKPGKDARIGRATTNKAGRYSLVRRSLKKGRYYAATAESNPGAGVVCLAAKSKAIKIKRK